MLNILTEVVRKYDSVSILFYLNGLHSANYTHFCNWPSFL
jgi:hypothetical protein